MGTMPCAFSITLPSAFWSFACFGGDKSTLGGESPASMVIAVADVAQVVALDATQSARQPTPSPLLQEQNQTDRMLERSQDRAEEQEDFLTIQD